MRAKELLASAQRIGVEPDPAAARAFRLAAVRLSKHRPDSDGWRDAASSAAKLLVALALVEAEDDLRSVLTPDPDVVDLTWTVACYQIGDLTPSALRDFPDPVEAVITVAVCPEEAHVAAELVVSSSTGLRWTAVTRTNDLLTFQLPTSDTASDGSGERPGDLAAALRRWREQLSAWERGEGLDGGSPYAAEAARQSPYRARPSAEAAAGRQDDRFGGLETRLAGIEGMLSAMADALDGAMGSMMRRDDRALALEANVLGASLESVRQEARDRTQTMERLEEVIDVRFRALAAYVAQALGRLDLRLEAETSSNRTAASDAVEQLEMVEPLLRAAMADRNQGFAELADLVQGRAEATVERVEASIGAVEERVAEASQAAVARAAEAGQAAVAKAAEAGEAAVAKAAEASRAVVAEASELSRAAVAEAAERNRAAVAEASERNRAAVVVASQETRAAVAEASEVNRAAVVVASQETRAAVVVASEETRAAVVVASEETRAAVVAVSEESRAALAEASERMAAIERLQMQLQRAVTESVELASRRAEAAAISAIEAVGADIREDLANTRAVVEQASKRAEAAALTAIEAARADVRLDLATTRAAIEQVVQTESGIVRKSSEASARRAATEVAAAVTSVRSDVDELRSSLDTSADDREKLQSDVHDIEKLLARVEAISRSVHNALIGGLG